MKRISPPAFSTAEPSKDEGRDGALTGGAKRRWNGFVHLNHMCRHAHPVEKPLQAHSQRTKVGYSFCIAGAVMHLFKAGPIRYRAGRMCMQAGSKSTCGWSVDDASR